MKKKRKTNKAYFSGEELAKYLHVSKKKMRYLLENKYIPAIDTGKKTHRYQIEKKHAQKLKKILEQTDITLALKGKFGRIPPKVSIEPSDGNIIKFREFLTDRWKNEPDALYIRRASELTGFARQRLGELCNKEKIQYVKVGRRFVLVKMSFIEFCSSKDMLSRVQITPEFRKLASEFLKTKNEEKSD